MVMSLAKHGSSLLEKMEDEGFANAGSYLEEWLFMHTI